VDGNGSQLVCRRQPLHITTWASIVNDNGAGGVIRGTLDAQSVDANTILVKYTYTGDMDLDGDVDADDYAKIDGGLQLTRAGIATAT